jgi:DNA-binding CsgD family transcriptional regulator
MPNSGAAARVAFSDATQEAIGLIAGGCTGEAIAEILAIEGFSPVSFDGVKALTDVPEGVDPWGIVLWLESSVSSVPSLLEPLTTRFEQVPVVLACAAIRRREVRVALAAGAAGVVVYDELDSTLGPCLRAVRVGQICVPRGYGRQIEPPVLSTREKQILGLVVMGYMNAEIARRLFLAESTVKSHLSSAFGKLGVRSRNEAVDLILRPEHGLGMGILALGGDPVLTVSAGAQPGALP